jgi:hypothetical protein
MSTPFTARRVTGLAVGGLALLLAGSSTGAAERCFDVRGSYTEQLASGPDCTSPVGLCIEGTYRGSIRGDFEGAASALIPTADTPTTGVVLFISDARIDARVNGREGELIIKNSGAFHTTGAGEIVDLQTIVGGTDELAGATGALRAEGTFTAESGGRSSYLGTDCLP